MPVTRRSPATAALTGLAPSTTYHYRAEAIRENGAVAIAGADRTFTTAAQPPSNGGGGTPAPTPPPSNGGGGSTPTPKPTVNLSKLGTISFSATGTVPLRFTVSGATKGAYTLTAKLKGKTLTLAKGTVTVDRTGQVKFSSSSPRASVRSSAQRAS